ncbi:Peptide-methionine (R)-S-oxide reductase MsrB [hydrothermal vent metagenome]|uniref:peptide-methionine (R)-S-oxide reductase n=1 Tax=hydrothermal vent metagenome TaxID=652676 RepID=A0A3B0Y515_9ZZZZ
MNDKTLKDEEHWKQSLTREQFEVTRRSGTERAFSGKYHDCKTPGTYACACCGNLLFLSEHKFDSGTGWPSYWQAVNPDAIRTVQDKAHGMLRVEVLCANCDAHLGHVFEDGPRPTGLRYCINSLSLNLGEKGQD